MKTVEFGCQHTHNIKVKLDGNLEKSRVALKRVFDKAVICLQERNLKPNIVRVYSRSLYVMYLFSDRLLMPMRRGVWKQR